MYIITGGAGFIGSAFAWYLNQSGIEDILLVDNLGHTDKWKNLPNLQFREYLQKDVFLDMLRKDEIPSPEAIIHMGACSSTTENDADYLMENNYRYSKILALFALKHRARFIQASSAATYGAGGFGFSDDHDLLPLLRPMNMYGFSKHFFDLWALKQGYLDNIVCLKFFNVFGPNEYHKNEMKSVVCKAYEQFRSSGQISLFKSYRQDFEHGEQKRDFIYIKDCLKIIHWFIDHPEINGVFNVGTGQARTWNDLAGAVFKALGQESKIEYIDMPEFIRSKYQYYTQAKMEKLFAAGWQDQMTSLEQAVKDYVLYLENETDPYLGSQQVENPLDV